MRAALHNAGGGNEGELSFFLQLGDGERAAVAHSGFYLVEGEGDVVLQTSRVGDVGVHTLFERQLARAAEVVALSLIHIYSLMQLR